MKNLKAKISEMTLFSTVLLILSLMVSTVNAQKDNEISSQKELEELQDVNMEYLKQIHEIIKDYPAFSYMYEMEDGRIEDVEVTGVDNTVDKKKLEVILFDLKSNRNKIKNQANRIGVFYSVDEQAKYEGGREVLQRKIKSNLNYPEEAQNWGVEGTVFVKFVVDENGEIPFATTASNVETSMETYVEDLEQQAVSAIKATSGDWECGKVEGVDVASLVVVPITFDFRKDPSMRAFIR